MHTTTIDLSAMLEGIPEGAWVAISEQAHKVVAYAADLQTVLQKAKEQGVDEPLIVRVPEQSRGLFL